MRFTRLIGNGLLAILVVCAIAFGLGMMASFAFAAPAQASWTHLGGDPLLPSIKGNGQTARNDFVKKSRTAKFKKATKVAGLNSKERKTVASAISQGKFKQCTLKYGDRFLRMAYGARGVFVDRNVTFKDPRYKSKGAPAFCLTVKVKTKKGNKTVTKTISIVVPWKCVNFSIKSKKTTTTTPAAKLKKEKSASVPQAPSCSVVINGDNNGNAGCGNVQVCTANGGVLNEVCPTVVVPPAQTPPPPVAPTVSNVTQPQEVYVNETYPNICADVTSPAGTTVSVVFSAKYGQFKSGQFTHAGGSFRLCTTYSAPGDVTPSGTDTITVKATDVQSGLSASASSDPFPVWRQAVNP